ncbi:hypothetical protein BVI2075_430016 [Burkholderia vietnamiensis]|nr:hypothetical protein BVI2075_430016 [Burkholderia vietnamiensis]
MPERMPNPCPALRVAGVRPNLNRVCCQLSISTYVVRRNDGGRRIASLPRHLTGDAR